MRKRHTRRRFVATALGAAGLSSAIASSATARREDDELGREEAIQTAFDAASKLREAFDVDGTRGLTVGAEPNAAGDVAITLNGFQTVSEAREWDEIPDRAGRGRGRGGPESDETSDSSNGDRGRGGRGRREKRNRRGRRRAILRSKFRVGKIPESVRVPVGPDRGKRQTTTFPVEVRLRVHKPDGHPGKSPHEAETFEHEMGDVSYKDPRRYRPLVSGALIAGSRGSFCSLGAPARDGDGTRYATTAGHCFDVGETVHQPHMWSQRIGEVTHSRRNRYGEFDGALIELDDDVAYDGDLTLGNGRYAEFQGAKTMGDLFWELYDSGSAWYTKYGAKTGATGGPLGGIVSFDQDTFWVDANASGGDSGAACWNYADNHAAGAVNGPHVDFDNCGLGCPDDIPGMHDTMYTAYEGIEDRFGVTVAP